MKLIVGLGNFPPKYRNTRHNVGFMLLDQIHKKGSFEAWIEQKKFSSIVARGEYCGHKCVLLKPQTLMNLSGNAVEKFRHFYRIRPEDVWVLSDDLDQDFGLMRYREKGSAGGHNGIRDLIRALGTEVFPRLKIGISNTARTRIPTENFVLQSFSAEEKIRLPMILDQAEEKLLTHLRSC